MPSEDRSEGRAAARRWLDRGTYFFLFIFVLAAPDSIAATQIAYSGALLCWLLALAVERRRPRPQPLVVPMLVFLTLSGVSAALSFAPLMSLPKLKSVALLLICILWAQNLKSLRQLKLFSAFLMIACLASVAYTAWQYTVGIGVRLDASSSNAILARLGLQDGDSISSLNGRFIRDPTKLAAALKSLPSQPSVRATVLRSMPLQKIRLELNHAQLASLAHEVRNKNIHLSRGHPLRAQGFYDHYVTYAHVLVQIALLALGLFAACPRRRVTVKTILGLVTLAMAGALWLTLTRAAMASFLACCLLLTLIVYGWRIRLLAIGFFVVAILLGGFLLREGRGLTWLDLHSPGDQYRLMMWKDGLRLIGEHPVWGVGMDSVRVYWRKWNIEAYKVFPLHSHFHSTPIQIAVERGLFTFLAWLWLVAEYLRMLLRLLRRTMGADWFARGLALGIFSATCGFLLGSLVDYSWGDSLVIMVFWLFAGWAASLDYSLTVSLSPSETPSTF